MFEMQRLSALVSMHNFAQQLNHLDFSSKIFLNIFNQS